MGKYLYEYKKSEAVDETVLYKKKRRKVISFFGIVAVGILLTAGVIWGVVSVSAKEAHPADGAKQNPVSVQQYERDGQLYELRTFDWFDIEVPINQLEFTGKEDVAYEEQRGLTKWIGANPKYMQEIQGIMWQRKIPVLFENVQDIRYIDYTMQNGCSSFYEIESMESISKIFQHIKSETKRITPEEQEELYIYTYMEFNLGAYSKMKKVKEEMENTMIRADVMYVDGTTETIYFSMEFRGQYNTEHATYCRLTME